ncbi:hypothetical protein BC833DRAFT_605142 [Globomyces pollinis-pini]|nr:hypothetical protein BC833DRAFT_605142 [Globomyces pollinis-pini]
MPNNRILKLITFPPPKEHFYPFVTEEGRSLPPRISYSDQWRLRRTCENAGLDAEKLLGLPPIPEIPLVTESQIGTASNRPIEKVTRAQKIAENMAQMDKRVAEYREKRRKLKESTRPELPF